LVSGFWMPISAISYSGDSAEAFYGALSYLGDFGKIQIGAPRNALDDYVNAPTIAGTNCFDFPIAPFHRQLLANRTP